MKTSTIALERLVEDFDIYPRTMVSGPHVTAICDAISTGEDLPPIVVDKKSMRIIDGFHRTRAAKRLKLESIECELRTYKSEADLFADAVRLNASHGRPLVPFERKRAVEILRRLGTDDRKIISIVKIPMERIVSITSRFSMSEESGEQRAVKASHESMIGGGSMTAAQESADHKRDGMNPTYHANQLIIALESELWSPTPAFQSAMDRLVELWRTKKTA